MKGHLVDSEVVELFCQARFGDFMHGKRVLSVAHGALGVAHCDDVSVAGVGRGLARARGGDPKHGIKQVDRMLSNERIALEAFFRGWVPWLIGERDSVVVALDWTEHAHDSQSTIALHLVTRHGRATPLVWKTVRSTELKDRRNGYEDELLLLFHRVMPEQLEVTVLADRGFGDTALYGALDELEFDYVIRSRKNVHMEAADGRSGPMASFLAEDGAPTRYDNVRLTADRRPVEAVVTVHDKGMADAWYLVTSRSDSAARIVELYGRRFTIEEGFRDTKDLHFGLGLSATHIGRPDRRDRFLMSIAIAIALLTLLGRAGESIGLDKRLRANTAKKRTHSLFRQGREYLRGSLWRFARDIRYAFRRLLKAHPTGTTTLAWL